MGGNIFDNSQSILKENIFFTMEAFISEMIKLFPNKKDSFRLFESLGSVGKKDISGDIDLGYDISNFRNRMEDILKEMKLPTLSEIKSITTSLQHSVSSMFTENTNAKKIDELIKWANNYRENIGWEHMIFNPTKDLQDYPPIPIIFSDESYMDGTVNDIDEVNYLAFAYSRYNEMLRYNYVRNIVIL